MIADRQTILESIIAIVGAAISVLLGFLDSIAADPSKLEAYKTDHSLLLDLLAVQYSFWLISVSLILGCATTINKTEAFGKLFLPSILLGVVVILLLAITGGSYLFNVPNWLRIGVPDVISIILLFFAIHGVVEARKIEVAE